MKSSIAQRRTLIIGTGPFVGELLFEITRDPECGYRIVGMVTSKPQLMDRSFGYPLLGTLENLNLIIQLERPEVIIVALPLESDMFCEHQLLEARVCHNIKIEQAEEVYEKLTGKVPIEALAPRGLIYTNDFRLSSMTLLSTRLLSLVSAIVGLVLFAPLLLLISILIKLDSSGPVLFVQDRVGFGGKSFKLKKFRTMRPSGQKTSEWEGDNLHRITRVGKILRKFRLDELPQFLNILQGDMNLVGPRPHPASNLELFVLVSRNMPECGIQIPYYTMRYSVLPGITGWAQVRYQYANNINEEIEKLRFDLFYIKHYSLWFDIRIIFETVRIVIAGQDRETGSPVLPLAAVDPVTPVLSNSPPVRSFLHEKSRYSR